MNMIFHQQQPTKSRLCGQACVAMLAGVDLDTAILAFDGWRKGTTPQRVIQALRALGVACGDDMERGELPPRAMLIIKYPRGGRHWCILWDYELYDPGASEAKVQHWSRGRVEQFLPLYC